MRTVAVPLHLLIKLYKFYYNPATDYRNYTATQIWDKIKNLEGCSVGTLLDDTDAKG